MKKIILLFAFSFSTFLINAQTFTEIFKSVAFDREAEDRSGYSVDISGNYAVMGTYGDDFSATNPNMGSAYIFEKTGLTNWTFVQKISSSDQDDYDRFGYSVAIEDDYIVVGSYGDDEDTLDGSPLSKAGSAYIFKRGEDGVWTEMQKIVASDRDAGDEFGWSVAISNTTIVIGAHHEGHDVDGLNFEYHAGSIYVFELESGVWTETQKLVASDRTDDHHYPDGRPDEEDLSDLFGGCVAISGDYIVAGSHMHDYGPSGVGTGFLWNQGAAYVFERSGGTWTEAQKLQCSIRKAWDRFGYDVDIDSSTIIVGAYAEDESEFEGASLMNAGGAYIFKRDASGDWLQTQKLDASDRTTGDHFGIAVSIEDKTIVIGAEQEDLDSSSENELSNAGGAYIFTENDAGVWAEIQKVTPSDRSTEDYFGESVAVAGHTVVVGAWQQDFNQIGTDSIEDAGAAYFFSSIICEAERISQDITICAGTTYTVGDTTYTLSGTYIDTLINRDGCDSIITTNLTINPPLTGSQAIYLCFGESYSIGDSTYSATGSYTNLLTTAEGCDSILTTNLTIEDENITNQTLTLCFGETLAVGDSVYTTSGVYTDTLVSTTSCDSIVNTDLTILELITGSQDIYLCFGGSYTIGGSTYTTSGTYLDTLTSAAGCDSLVTTNLTIEDENITDQAFHLCFGDSLIVGTTTYLETGIYADTLISITGCDSIVNTDLFIEDENITNQTLTLCFGETLAVGDTIYTASGVYTDTLVSATSCDSIVNTDLTILELITGSQDIYLCFGESYTIGESTYSASGTYLDTLTSVAGCDSLVTTNLTIEEENVTDQTFTICYGDYITVGDTNYTTSGTYSDTLVSASSCDSIVNTVLTVLPPVAAEINTITPYNLEALSSDEITTGYQWVICDTYTGILGATEQTYDPSFDGSYAVIITKGECVDTSDCVDVIGLGIDQNKHELFSVYPNPATAILNISLASINKSEVKIELKNSLGQVVYKDVIEDKEYKMNTSHFQRGVYFLTVLSADQKQTVRVLLQ